MLWRFIVNNVTGVRCTTMQITRRTYPHLTLIALSLVSLYGFSSDAPAICKLAKTSVISLSSSGLPQVSNLGDIEITCSVPARPLPTEPDEGLNGLQVRTTAYELHADGTRTVVPSDVNISGGGRAGFASAPEPEWVNFSVYILLEPALRDEEVRKELAWLEEGMKPEKLSDADKKRGTERLRYALERKQHRVGHFQLRCSVTDGSRVLGVGTVELEVLYKGRATDSLPSEN